MVASRDEKLDELANETVLEHATDAFERIRKDPALRTTTKRRLLGSSPPRFLWRTSWYVDDEPVIEVLLDATNVHHSFYCWAIIVRNQDLGASLFVDREALRAEVPFDSAHRARWMDRMLEAVNDWATTTEPNK